MTADNIDNGIRARYCRPAMRNVFIWRIVIVIVALAGAAPELRAGCGAPSIYLYDNLVSTGAIAYGAEGQEPDVVTCSQTIVVPKGTASIEAAVGAAYNTVCYGLLPFACAYSYSTLITLGGSPIFQQSGTVNPTIASAAPWSSEDIYYPIKYLSILNTIDMQDLTEDGPVTLSMVSTMTALDSYRTFTYMSVGATFQAPIKLEAFQWSYAPGERTTLSYYRKNSDWREDTLVDGDGEDAVQVTNPRWSDQNLDSYPEVNDPIAYMTGATPVIGNLALRTAFPHDGPAKIRITTSTEGLSFPDVDVTFENGQASFPYSIVSSASLGANIMNTEAELVWSVSFDDGASYTPFQSTYHKLWATFGQPYFIPGLSCCGHWTAARIERATNDSSGASSPGNAATQIRANLRQMVQFGENSITDSAYQGNPWAILDQWATGFDCISLAVIAATELGTVGVDSGAAYAFPTGGIPAGDGDASTQEVTVVESVGVVLDFFWADGVTINNGEGFFYLAEEGVPFAGYTVEPALGPFEPFQGQVLNLPGEPWKRLALSAMRSTLSDIRSHSSSPRGGQQWWVEPDSSNPKVGTPVGSNPVAFPISIP